MANDVNKGQGSVNGKQVPKHIREAFQQRDYNVSYEHLSTKEDFSNLSERLEKMEDSKSQATDPAVQQALAENMAYTEADLSSVEAGYATRYNEQLASTIGTYAKTRNINERTTTMSGQQKYFRQARTSQDRYAPTEVLEQRIQGGVERAATLGTELAGRARGLGTEETVPETLVGKASKLQEIQEEVAYNKRLMKVQRREGLSTEKRQYSAAETMERAGGFLSDIGLKQDVSAGKYSDIDTETKKLSETFSNLSDALQRFEEASENATDAQGNLTEEYQQASKDLDRLQRDTEQQRRVVGEVSRQGGGGGAFGRYGAMMELGSMAGQAISSGARATYQIAGGQDIQQMRNRSAFANMANTIYDQAGNAIEGNNIDSLFDVVASDQFARGYAGGKQKLANVTGAIGAGTDVITQTATGALKGAAGGAAAGVGIGNPALGAGIGGVSGGISGLAQSLPGLTNVMYGNVGAEAAQAGYGAARELSAAERHVRTRQMQRFYDQGNTTYNTTMGLGNRQSYGIQSRLMNQGMLGQLAEAGISPEQASEMSAQLGDAGYFDTAEGFDMMRGAGQAAQRGQMSRGQYMGAATRLRAAGGGQDDLGEIMETAVAKGMDNAKNINQLVDATIQMSSGLAMLGVSGISAMGKMVGGATQGLVDIGVDKNLAVGMATGGISNYNQQIQDSGFNLGNIVERQKIRQDPNFSGASIFQLNALSQMGADQHAIFREAAGGDEDALKQARIMARNMGVSELMFDKEGQINKGTVQSLQGAAFSGAALNLGAAGMQQNILKKIQEGRGDEITDKERAIMFQGGFNQETLEASMGATSPSKAPADLVLRRKGQQRDITASKRGVSEFAEGQKLSDQLGPDDAFKNMETLMQGLSEVINPETFGDVVSKAAEDFRVPVADFKDHVDKFGKVIDKQQRMLERMGEMRGGDYSDIPSGKKKTRRTPMGPGDLISIGMGQ